MGIDFHLISNFAALALITLAGPAVIFILSIGVAPSEGSLPNRNPSHQPVRPMAMAASFTRDCT